MGTGAEAEAEALAGAATAGAAHLPAIGTAHPLATAAMMTGVTRRLASRDVVKKAISKHCFLLYRWCIDAWCVAVCSARLVKSECKSTARCA